MGYTPYSCGYQRVTASGAIGDAGKPVLLCGYGVESGGTAAQPYFNNGGALAGSDVAFRPGPITVSQGNVNAMGLPIMFPKGLWISFDANTTAVTAMYVLQSVTT